ncbi:hypothetical protein D3C85_1458780 [compost metagenome]
MIILTSCEAFFSIIHIIFELSVTKLIFPGHTVIMVIYTTFNIKKAASHMRITAS